LGSYQNFNNDPHPFINTAHGRSTDNISCKLRPKIPGKKNAAKKKKKANSKKMARIGARPLITADQMWWDIRQTTVANDKQHSAFG